MLAWSIGYFGVKDLFTIINLLGGVVGIHFALAGLRTLAAFRALVEQSGSTMATWPPPLQPRGETGL